MDERDISVEKKWSYEKSAQTAIASLEKHNMSGYWADDKHAARTRVLEMVPEGLTVGFGDSVTLSQIGIAAALLKRGANKIFNPFALDEEGHWIMPKGPGAFVDAMRNALNADVFLSGSNALTLDGKLVNVDGIGNRVAGLIFGGRKVIVVVGANKIVKNVEEALERIRNVAAPINAKRHHLRHLYPELPCVKTGQCSDCNHDMRICCSTVIIEHQMCLEPERRMNVVIVGEDLGI